MNEQQERELYLLDYLDALESGDDSQLEKVLKIAEHDPVLTQMIVDLHSELEPTELLRPETMPQEDSLTILKEQRQQERRQATSSGWLPLVAVLVMTVIGGVLLFTVQSENFLSDVLSNPTDEFIFIEGEIDCAFASIPQSECETLLLLYDSTDGENWLVKRGWLENNDPCRWTHITCRDGHVVGLDFNGNRLNGIVLNLNELLYLEVFDAGKNALSGNLDLYSNLPRLRYLDLSDNHYNNGFPDFDTLPALTHLNLARNGLRRTPPLLQSDSLEHLDLADNALTGTLQNLASFPNLQFVDLSQNDFFGTIRGLDQLTGLVHLDIRENRFATDLAGLEVATGLAYLDISHNPITELAIDLEIFTMLENVSIDGISLDTPSE